jgi:hypothetical protein
MKWFREMARRLCLDENAQLIQKVTSRATISPDEIIADCQPIVIHDDVLSSLQLERRSDRDSALAAPFRVFSMELASGKPLFGIGASRNYRSCLVLVAFEVKPGEFYSLAYCRGESEHDRIVTFNENFEYLPVFIDAISSSEIGVERTHQHFNIGTSRKPKLQTIRKIIHVRPKRIGASLSTDSRHIDWSHAWLVRGHWRKTDGIGKDRAGDYCVQGMTWVTEHTKGPDDAPIVPKVRLVHAAPKELQ